MRRCVLSESLLNKVLSHQLQYTHVVGTYHYSTYDANRSLERKLIELGTAVCELPLGCMYI
jgi:hypothetical protein